MSASSRKIPALFVLMLGIAASLAGTNAAQASAPPTINIRGQLFDADGIALTGMRGYTVKFYPQESGGVQLGTDVSGTADVSAEGIFNLSIEPPEEALSGGSVWYEISVDSSDVPNGVDANDTFPDRIKIESVPFSLQAGEAEHVEAAAVGSGNIDEAEFDFLDGVTSSIQTQLNDLPVAANVYTKAEVDATQLAQDELIADKADSADVYTRAEVDELASTKSTFAWELTSSTDVQAAPNRGYMANDAALVTITLPASEELAVGDTIRVSGLGEGGWKILQNDGQEISIRSLEISDYSAEWTARNSSRFWRAVASSSDGTKLVACETDGLLYTSTNSGETWEPREESRNWVSLASSSDGTMLVAAEAGGKVYTSSDSGVTWTPGDLSRGWYSLASSSDGTKLLASAAGDKLYTSSNSGVTWTPRDIIRNWRGVASSSDGTKLVAGVSDGYLYTSSDSGVSWDARQTDSTSPWISVASSSDGTKLIACEFGGNLYTSTDSGVTWTARESGRTWFTVASSADGTKLVATVLQQDLYRSSDSGLTWTPQDSFRDWYSVASSSDGTKLVAAIRSGFLYTYDSFLSRTTVGVLGTLSGGADAAVELQYVGSDTFRVLSYAGELRAN